jgi:WD40 repeat protein
MCDRWWIFLVTEVNSVARATGPSGAQEGARAIASEWFGGTAIRHTAREQEAPAVKDAHVRPRGRRMCRGLALVVALVGFSLWSGAWERPGGSRRASGFLEAAPDRRTASIRGLAFASDGRELLAAGDGRVNVWALPEAKRVRTLTMDMPVVNSLAVSPDGTVAAAGGGVPGKTGIVQLWDWPAGRPRPPIITRTDVVRAIAFRPDGQCLAAANTDGAARVHSVAVGALRFTVTGHRTPVRAVAFSPDSRVLATGGADGTIRLWDAETGAPLRTLSGHSGAVQSLCFAPRGAMLASGGADGTVRLWQYSSGLLARSVRGFDGEVRALAYRRDGARLAALAPERGVFLLDAVSGAVLRTLRAGSEAGAREPWAPAGPPSGQIDFDRDSSQQRGLGPGRRAGRLTALAYHPDGSMLVVGGTGGEAYLWDVRAGRMVAAVAGAAAP